MKPEQALFALKDMESGWQWIGRVPVTEAQCLEVSQARCNHGPAIACIKQALDRLAILEDRCAAHARIEGRAA